MIKRDTFSSSLIAANVYFEIKMIKDYTETPWEAGVLGGENQYINTNPS